jgi:hypothetical protein
MLKVPLSLRFIQSVGNGANSAEGRLISTWTGAIVSGVTRFSHGEATPTPRVKIGVKVVSGSIRLRVSLSSNVSHDEIEFTL